MLEFLKEVKEKVVDFIEMYTISEIFNFLMHAFLVIFVVSLVYSLYHDDPDKNRKIDMELVEIWNKYDKLPQEDPIPNLPDSVITHIAYSKDSCTAQFVVRKKDPAGDYWQRRHVVCDDGWYHRLNDENSFEAVVGRSNGKRATAQYIQGAGGDAMPQYLYVCEKYVGCEPKIR